MPSVHVVDHPLIQHKLSILRNKETGPKEFRELTDEIALLMAYEVTRDLPLEEVEIETPARQGARPDDQREKTGVVPILRAGLGMVGGILKLIPAAKVGHVGVYRDPATLKPVEYYCKFPADASERDFIVVDPMLATGGSAAATVGFLKERGDQHQDDVSHCGPRGDRGLCTARTRMFPSTQRPSTATSTSEAYIVPGLGDAGDRLFGTQ